MNNSLLSFGARSVDPKILEQTLTVRAEVVEEIERKCVEKAKHNTTYQSLVIAPRGSGKTHIIKVLYHRLKNNNELSNKIVIAYMSEDEIGIANLTDLIVNILRSFIRYNEPNSETLEAKISKASIINNPTKREQFLKNTLVKYAEKKIVILLVENFDKILNAIGHNGQGGLRDFIHQYNNLSIIATSQNLISSLLDSKKPFYNFFNVFQLNKLSYDETVFFFKSIAKMQNNEELLVELEKPTSKGKLRAIYELTDGNHRLLVTFYSFLKADFKSDLSSNFIKVMNDLKPYYEQFVNALPPNQQKIVRYLSSNRKAIGGKEIARACFLDANTSSKQLSLLYERGMIDKNKVGKDVYYELKEPLMRICFEIGDNPNGIAKLFVDFLTAYYDKKELIKKYLEYKYGAKFQVKELKHKYAAEAQMYSLALDDNEKNKLLFSHNYYDNIKSPKELQSSKKNLDNIAKKQNEKYNEYIQQGIVFINRKEFQKAVNSFEMAIKIFDKDEIPYFNKGIALGEMELKEDAINCYQKALKLNPKRIETYNNIGICYSELEKDDKALEYFLIAEKQSPTDKKVLHNLSRVYYKLNRFNDALNKSMKLLTLLPNDVDVLNNIGLLHRLMNENEQAIDFYKRVVEKRPNDSVVLNEIAFAYNNLNKTEKAEEYLKKAIIANPNNGDACHNLGILYGQGKDYKNAIKYYLKAIELSPNNELAYNNLGVAYSGLKQFNMAINSYLKSIELKPDYWEALGNIGISYTNVKEYKKALNCFQKAIDINPNDEKSLYNIGVVYGLLNDYKNAISQFQKLLQINPNNEAALENLASIFLDEKMYSKSIKIYETILKNNKTNSFVYNNLAYAYLLNGDVDKGIEVLNNGLMIDPKNIHLKYSLLGAYIRLNDINESKKLIKSLIYKTDDEIMSIVFPDDIFYNLFKYGSDSFIKLYFEFILKLLQKRHIPNVFWSSLNTSLFNILIDIEDYSNEQLSSITNTLEELLVDYPESIIPMKMFAVGVDSIKNNNKSAIYRFTKEERKVFTESVLNNR